MYDYVIQAFQLELFCLPGSAPTSVVIAKFCVHPFCLQRERTHHTGCMFTFLNNKKSFSL